jgi:hypothetical protein
MAWDSHYRSSLIKDLLQFDSDPYPLVLQTNGITPPSSQLFRFEKECILNEEFNQLVHKWWLEITLWGDIGLSWYKNWKNLDKELEAGIRILWMKNIEREN